MTVVSPVNDNQNEYIRGVPSEDAQQQVAWAVGSIFPVDVLFTDDGGSESSALIEIYNAFCLTRSISCLARSCTNQIEDKSRGGVSFDVLVGHVRDGSHARSLRQVGRWMRFRESGRLVAICNPPAAATCARVRHWAPTVTCAAATTPMSGLHLSPRGGANARTKGKRL